MSKIMLLAAAGAGYVLGSRAGRSHYDAIAEKATSLWQDPRVQEKADQAQQLVKEKGAELQDKASDLAPSRGGSHADTSGAAGSTTPSSTPSVTPTAPTTPTTPPVTPSTTTPPKTGPGSLG